jgi:hypothetical protein
MFAFDGRSVRRQAPSIQSMWIGASPQQFTGGGSRSHGGRKWQQIKNKEPQK